VAIIEIGASMQKDVHVGDAGTQSFNLRAVLLMVSGNASVDWKSRPIGGRQDQICDVANLIYQSIHSLVAGKD
jgi:hypothetical protein